MLRQLSRRRAFYRRLNVQMRKNRDKESKEQGEGVPKGYVPVMVGKEKADGAKFLVHIDMFKNEYFAGLLEMAAQEVGYGNHGILTIPCDAECFRNLMEPDFKDLVVLYS